MSAEGDIVSPLLQLVQKMLTSFSCASEQTPVLRPKLVPYAGRFDGFHAVPASVSKTCLVRFSNL
jgi:hypothetical protein